MTDVDTWEPELTTKMVLHLNRGPAGGDGVYEVLADGEPTEITYAYSTGRGAKYTAKRLRFAPADGEEEVLDLLNPGDEDPEAWIRARITKPTDG